MKRDPSDSDFDKILAENWDSLNRREKRLAKFKKNALKDAFAKPSHGKIQSIAGTTVTNEIRK